MGITLTVGAVVLAGGAWQLRKSTTIQHVYSGNTALAAGFLLMLAGIMGWGAGKAHAEIAPPSSPRPCRFALLAPSTTAQAIESAGPALIVDGDTIEIGQQSIRIHGIDAPDRPEVPASERQLRLLRGDRERPSTYDFSQLKEWSGHPTGRPEEKLSRPKY